MKSKPKAGVSKPEILARVMWGWAEISDITLKSTHNWVEVDFMWLAAYALSYSK